ncbi:MAG: DUF1553 domain-containing protein [Lentisphaeria bacterium]|nr:DUF1553 domain-containing protein [Lentisphaeria bacterium]
MRTMLSGIILLLSVSIRADSPFTDVSDRKPPVPGDIAPVVEKADRILEARRKKFRFPVIGRASDAVFLRRSYLTAAGRIPTLEETKTFLGSTDPAKRAKLIDSLLESPDHADLIAMRFADMLRIKSEFPVNLWPNAVQAFHYQLRLDIFRNRPYSEMAFEMLTASGSNFRVPYANFFRGSGDRTPAGLAKITALTFMGVRTEKLPEERRRAFEAFFSRIRYKSSSEWKEEFVFTSPEECRLKAWLPGAGSFTIDSPGEDPRRVLAQALIADRNPYFARAFVNRAWSWFFGKGLIDPVDDISPEAGFGTLVLRRMGLDSAPESEVLPELLDLLTEEFRRSNYNMRHLFRLIMNSGAFHAASVVPPEIRQQTEKYFLSYPVRRLEAELLSDSLGVLTGNYGRYTSVIPEPFTFLPSGTRAVQIADGSISSAMLELFGRPSRDSGKISERNNRITGAQRLYLLNSNVVYRRLSALGWKTAKSCKWDLKRKGITTIYQMVLSRHPVPLEKKWIMDYQRALPQKQRGHVWPDLFWVLVNSKEFLYHH